MDKSVLYTVIITFFITVLFCGLVMYFFAGSLNFFGTQGFHGKFEYFAEGVILGAVFIAPVIVTIVLLIRRYKRYALVSGGIAVLLWIIGAVIIPFIITKIEAARDSAPAAEIAARAIARTEKDKDISVKASGKFAFTVGNRLWIYEGTATRLSAAKEKEVAECAAKQLIENREMEPQFISYEWRPHYNENEVYYYELLLFYQDGTYVEMYNMDKERWQELN